MQCDPVFQRLHQVFMMIISGSGREEEEPATTLTNELASNH